jgi:hypothetical protein
MEISTHESTSTNTFIVEHNAQAQQRQQRIQGMEDEITELAAHIHAATFRLLVACNSQIESISLGLLASGLVFTRLIAMAINLAPDRRQPPPFLRDPTSTLAVTGHWKYYVNTMRAKAGMARV